MTLETLIAAVETKKAELDLLRVRAPGGTTNFDNSQDLEITYTSNAIEGNTLTAVETTMVIEQGITVAGKPLKDHLEALDHFEAIRYVRDLARKEKSLSEMDVRNLHRLVMLRSNPDSAGRYAEQGRYVLTDSERHSFPSPAELPALMGDFAGWLSASADTPGTAFAGHRRLVDIHPFDDGNGRTARLLMNLVLIRGGASAGSAGVYYLLAAGSGRPRRRGVRATTLSTPRRNLGRVLDRPSPSTSHVIMRNSTAPP